MGVVPHSTMVEEYNQASRDLFLSMGFKLVCNNIVFIYASPAEEIHRQGLQ